MWASEPTHSLRQVDRGRQTAVHRALGGVERLPLVPSSQGILYETGAPGYSDRWNVAVAGSSNEHGTPWKSAYLAKSRLLITSRTSARLRVPWSAAMK